MASRERKSYLTPAHAKRLRESTGLSPQVWATLLDCGVQSVHNMESDNSKTSIGKQMAALMIYMAYPGIRSQTFEAVRYANELLLEIPKNTIANTT